MTARIAFALAVLFLAPGCGGGGDGAGDTGSGDGADDAPRLSVDLGAPFPDLPLTAATDAPVALPPDGAGWTVVGLFPRTCHDCGTELPDLAVQAQLWGDAGLGFVGVFESTPAEVGVVAARTRTEDLALAATEVPLFPVTRILDASTYVLVDSVGTVRFIARQAGILPERLQSLSRQHRVLRAGPEHQAALVRDAYPDADGVEIRSTLDTDWLGPRTLELGLSPWYGIVTDADGGTRAVVFPLERDTSCSTCEPMFLLVGIGRRGAIERVHPVEPVISLGEIQDTGPFFSRVRGVRSEEGLDGVPPMLNSAKADQVARQLLAVALDLAARIPSGLLSR